MSVYDIMIRNKEAYTRHALAFRQTFGRKLKDFWEGHLIGFDVIKFDEEVIQPPDGTSTHDVIRAEHGEEAVKMILDLIGSSS